VCYVERKVRTISLRVNDVVESQFSNKLDLVSLKNSAFSSMLISELMSVEWCSFHELCLLQAIAEQNYEVLEDWTYEAVYNIISTPMKEAEAANYKIINKFISSSDYEVGMKSIVSLGLNIFYFKRNRIGRGKDAT
jgi:hypothetical protein